MDGWVCGSCHSINGPRDGRCYKCRQKRNEVEEGQPRSQRPSETPTAVRIPLPGGGAGAAAWVVGAGTGPQAALDAVVAAAAKEMEHTDAASVAAWQRLTADDQMWVAGSFVLVALAVAMADGRIEDGEVERAFRKVDDINANTRSYVVNWATGILSDRRLLATVMATAFASPDPEPAFARARTALGKLPAPDRCRMAASLWSMSWHAITAKNGSPPTPDSIELRQLQATIARLGLDLDASMDWVKRNGP